MHPQVEVSVGRDVISLNSLCACCGQDVAFGRARFPELVEVVLQEGNRRHTLKLTQAECQKEVDSRCYWAPQIATSSSTTVRTSARKGSWQVGKAVGKAVGKTVGEKGGGRKRLQGR